MSDVSYQQNIDLSKFHFLPEDQVESTAHHVYQYINYFWVVHPEKGLAFYGKGYTKPQCNRDQRISDMLCPVWGVVKQIPRVIVPLNVNDYC